MVEQQEPKRGWWSRNWKWFVPTGCLGIVVLFLGGCAVLFASIFGVMKSSDAYKGAMMKINASPAAQEALGTPIEAGMIVSGNISVNDASGQAELAIPVSGPKGSGKLYVSATKTAGTWSYSTLKLETGGTSIDLIGPQPAPMSIPLMPQPEAAP